MLFGLNILISLMFLVLTTKIKPKNKKEPKNYIVYDIEADGVDFNNENEYGYYLPSNKEIIFSISFKGNDMHHAECLIIGVDSVSDEKDLLKRFADIASEYKILIGHNNIKFDDVLLLDRMKRLNVINKKMLRLLKGSNRLDTIELAKLLNYGKPFGKSLKGLAKELDLPVTKEDINPVIAFKDGKLDLLAKYNNRDVELTEMILLKIKGLEMVNELMSLTGCMPKHVTRNTKILEAFVNNNPEEYPIQSNPEVEGKNHGGFNYRRDTGNRQVLYKRYESLIHIDVSSMYPSLMVLIGANSADTYENYNIKTGEILPFKEIKQSGSVAKMVNFFVQERRKVKEQMKSAISEDIKDELDRKQKALKILCNSVYGALDTDYFIMANPKLASLITAMGRDILNACIREFEACYGKTDSIWINNAYTVDDVNEFVTKYLKEKYNLDNKEGILRFELENNVDTLIVVDKNDYVEITENGEYNFKGSKFNPISNSLSEFEYDISMKYAVNGESVDRIDDFIESKLKKPLSYFAKLEKLSEKTLHHAKNNTAWLEANKYHYLTGFSYNKVFTKYGYIIYDHIVPKILISREYVKYLAYNHLYNLGLLNDQPKKQFDKSFIPTVPVVPKEVKGKYRFIPNKSLIAKHLNIKNIDDFRGWDFYSKFNLSNIESEYKGLLCTKKTGYFFLDIDKNVDKWFKELKKVFPIKTRHWTTTRSGKYHIILKTEDERIFNLKLNTDEVELKTNELTPLYDNGEYGNYSPLSKTKPLTDIKNIGYATFVEKLQKVGLLDGEIELKEPEKPLDQYNLIELDDTVLNNVVSWVNKAIELYKENRDLISSNKYFMAIGNQLKLYLFEDDIIKILDIVKKFDYDLIAKTRSTALNKTEYTLGLQNSLKHTGDDFDDTDRAVYYILMAHNNSLQDIVSVQYRNIYGDDSFNIVEVLKRELLDYTNKYEEIVYGLVNILAMKVYKQYRFILLTDEQQTGKSFFRKTLFKLTPESLITLADYSSMTDSVFRQLCNIDIFILNGKIMFIPDTADQKIQDWLNILSTAKPVISQDNDSGYYINPKGKIGGMGVQYDKIYSKDGLIIFINNPKGFNMGLGGEERRTSILSLKPEPREMMSKRYADDFICEFQKVDMEQRFERIRFYINSIIQIDTPDIEVSKKYTDKLLNILTDDIGYYVALLKSFCLLENRTKITDDVFNRFLGIMQITKYQELDKPHLDLLEWLITYYIPVHDQYFNGLTDEDIIEKHKYTRKKQANRTFTVANAKASRQKRTVIPYADLLQGLAERQYLIRVCKNQKGNWIYALNETKLKEVGLL